MEVKK